MTTLWTRAGLTWRELIYDVAGGIRQQDIGLDAFALVRRAARAEELLDRDLEDAELDLAAGGAIEIGKRLHGAFAVRRPRTDDHRTSVIL